MLAIRKLMRVAGDPVFRLPELRVDAPPFADHSGNTAFETRTPIAAGRVEFGWPKLRTQLRGPPRITYIK
jgi:hypothetical protein